MSKIIQLSTENVKRLKAVNIKPDGSLVIIGGNNANGKSSVLDSIAVTLGGAEEIPSVPVRKGAESAKVVIDLGDMIVRRTIQPNGNTSLVIEDKEKKRFPSPQALLDSLTGRLTFDPLSFLTQESKKQLETLKTLVGLDFTSDDQERAKIYNERTVVNREVERAQISLSQAAHYPDVTEAVDVTALQTELQDAQKHNQGLSTLQLDASRKGSDYMAAKKSAENADARIRDLHEQIEALNKKLTQAEEDGLKAHEAQQVAAVASSEAEKAVSLFQARDVKPIQEKISSATEHNRKHATNQARATQEKTLADKKAEAEKLTKAIGEIDKRKNDKLAAAKFPVEGLSFGAGEVMFNGLPLSQASQAEAMRVSVGMAAAMNPKLRVALVRNGSLLDAENLALLETLAREHDLQVWIERVGTKDPSAIIIEDGMVVGAPVEEKARLPETTEAFLESNKEPGTAAEKSKRKPKLDNELPDLIP